LRTLAIIVNYKAADLTVRAAGSVLESDSLGPVQVVVVDNSQDFGEAERLRARLPGGTDLLVSPENIGFGRACNLAYDRFPGEYALLLNPDARLLPGCLLRLQEALLSAEAAAAVSPQVFWDERQEFLLPPSYPPALMMLEEILGVWSGPGAAVMTLLSRMWRRHAVRVWRARTRMEVSNLSGGLVFLKRDAVRKVGGLFDPVFFLYFEDTDLFLRLRKAGYTLLLEPRAEAIHYYNQCDRDCWDWKKSCMVESRRIFMRKHFPRWYTFLEASGNWFRRLPGPGRKSLPESDFTAPFTLDVPERFHRGWLFEWSPNPTLLPAVGRFGRGGFVDFPAECCAMLAPGRYFGRVGSPRGLGLGAKRCSWRVRAENRAQTA
jgi:GT2 family glycosyltransferase